MTSQKPAVGVLSIGDMGAGFAGLLVAHGFNVVTNVSDRSKATQERAAAAHVQFVSSDVELCDICEVILSIVPPKDALSTAERIAAAATDPSALTPMKAIRFLDLNAVSPESSRQIDVLFSQRAPQVRFLDGCIIGSPPKLLPDGTWTRPNIVLSGPHRLDQVEAHGQYLASTLKVKHQSNEIGSASGLKMCFASMTKGLTALAIQSFTTAHQLGVVEELQEQLKEMAPKLNESVNRSLPSMPPKAYRWVREMEEIASTFEANGGFTTDESIFRAIAKTYALVSDETELGKEQTDARVRGLTSEDVACLMAEGTSSRISKLD
ncbi:6-phosphogluconate dehydrogenase C-terminal domain-like protein [Polychaeton citri CBS 116435]|uniref:6-phosphogluconate dehydrogenase C-terminal domain-like protein n=1 Tax=Polychaeton citri CBS 116435 TaxID=1314669 RepID=A0A9P4Q312_9PEZI|nr:6-phosphogluconate dehydrogenase C-terminal domain-like protein [Polychaeton citri CBS 116435]